MFTSAALRSDLQRHVEDLVGVGPPDAPQQLLKVGHKSYSRSWEDINSREGGKNEDKKSLSPGFSCSAASQLPCCTVVPQSA